MSVARGLLCAGILAGAALPAGAAACPCQGAAGPGAAVTNASQLWGFSATTTGRLVHGAWDSEGDYSPLREGSRQWMLDLGLTAGVRPTERVEVGLLGGFGYQSVTAPGIDSSQASFGDTTARVRWEAIDEPMPFEKDRAAVSPAVAFVGAVRAPTGFVGRAGRAGGQSGTTGSIGSAASAQGLGAWEGSAAVALSQGFGYDFRLTLTGEAAYRLPDDALGVDRHLGPRALGQINFRYRPEVDWGVGIITDLGWEDVIAFEGVRRAGTAQRLWSVAGYAYMVFADAGLRAGAMVRTAPPVDTITVNAVAATSVGLSIGYAH